jgi:hypothetical protein
MTTKKAKTIVRELREELLIKKKYLELGFSQIVDISCYYQNSLFPINGHWHKTMYVDIACFKNGKCYKICITLIKNFKEITCYKIDQKTVISTDEYWRLHQKYGGIIDQEEINTFNKKNKILAATGSS